MSRKTHCSRFELQRARAQKEMAERKRETKRNQKKPARARFEALNEPETMQ
jgi:hypothetical protein